MNPVPVAAVPLPPSVALAGFDVRPVMRAGNVGERLRAQRPGVVNVRRPRLHQHLVHRCNHQRIVADGLPRPLLGNPLRRELGIPRQPSKRVQVRHRQRRAQPSIAPHIRHAHHAAQRPMKHSPRYNLFHQRCAAVHPQIEIQHPLPHRRKINQVPLLPQVLLRNLQLHCLAGLAQTRKQRRNRLLRLKIDWPLLGLHNHIRVKLPVQRMKNVVCRPRAIRLHIAVVQVVVVDKRAIKHHASASASTLAASAGLRP